MNINFRQRTLANLALEDASIYFLNSCFEKIVGFKRIMLDGLDRIVA